MLTGIDNISTGGIHRYYQLIRQMIKTEPENRPLMSDVIVQLSYLNAMWSRSKFGCKPIGRLGINPFRELFSLIILLINIILLLKYSKVRCLSRLHKFIEKYLQKDCRNPGSNQGPLDLQSNALPTELFRRFCKTLRAYKS